MLILRRAFFGFLLFSFILPSGTLLLPQTASGAAFGLVPCALKENNPATEWDERAPCTLCHFLIGMNFIVKLLRNIMTACAIAVIVAMAIIYITSAGDEGRMTFAKTGIKYSLIGFIVILLAWVMVNFIFTLPIFANNGLVRTGWDTFTCNTNSQAQVNQGAPKAASGIGNATGNAGSGQPGRESLPGSTPPSGGASCNSTPSCDASAGETCSTCPSQCGTCGGPTASCNLNGVCDGATEDCETCPSDCPCGVRPACGRTHYTCGAFGTSGSNLEASDGWTWTCSGFGATSSDLVSCSESRTGCGNGTQESGEACDTGGERGTCPAECSLSCTRNICTAPPEVLPGCGPSNGTSSAPVAPLCVGGAVASTVIESSVGTSMRYDWTCSVPGMSGSYQCSSGVTSVGGNPTATCGGAAGEASISAPSSDLCAAPGVLTVFGVQPLVHALTGEPLWYWSCQVGEGVATSCYAPRIVSGGIVGNAACGTVVNRSSGVDFPLLCSRGTVVGPSLDCRGDSTGAMINCSWTCKANDSEYTTSCSGTAPVVGG